MFSLRVVVGVKEEGRAVHSTANFRQEHLDEIRQVGEPAWLVESTCFHDTCAKAGRAALSEIPYLVPPGFKDADSLGASPLSSVPEEWSSELKVIEIGGMPKIREYAFLHLPSKTLILADLMFNLPPEVGRWTQMFLRAAGGIREYPGMSRLFRLLITDRKAFKESIREIAEQDFDRMVVAHGDPIGHDAKATMLGVPGNHRLAP